ncbi:hypothetical protein EUTSA_v10025992mg [Eutrema salsugineum]|uniref:Uncharacterized protein n=1 Tax=Eutrema salsugineum TaxID=72664 RepID=V4MJL8_EUTSA|nr:hypothetical protein EUTSA_v10025992mg [Eutrema salsugineum]
MESRSQDERENDDGVSSQENYKKAGSNEEDANRIGKEPELDTDERIEITDSSHDHDKSSSSSSSSGSSSSSSSDDESREVKKKEDDKENDDSVSEVITVPNQPVPIAGDAPFMGSTANVIVETTGLMDSTAPSDPSPGELIEVSHVDTEISNETPLPKPNEITGEVSLASDELKQASSSETGSDKKENEGKTLPLPESEVVISHEEEAPVLPTHGVAQRTSWLSCCGLFDVMTGSSK